jgi:hypothetical protein
MIEFGYAVLKPQELISKLTGSLNPIKISIIQVMNAPPAAINQWYPKPGLVRRRANITRAVRARSAIVMKTNMLSNYSNKQSG